jgi:hypothetical protein
MIRERGGVAAARAAPALVIISSLVTRTTLPGPRQMTIDPLDDVEPVACGLTEPVQLFRGFGDRPGEAGDLPHRAAFGRLASESHQLPDRLLVDVAPAVDLLVNREREVRRRVPDLVGSSSGRGRRAPRTSPAPGAASAA